MTKTATPKSTIPGQIWSPGSYIISTDGNDTYVMNCYSGVIESQDSNSLISNVLNNTLNKLSMGGEIIIKEGNYIVDKIITIPNDNIKLYFTKGASLTLANNVNQDMIYANGRWSLQIIGGIFGGNKLNQSIPSDIIHFINCKYSKIQDSQIENSSKYGINIESIGGPSSYNIIRDNWVYQSNYGNIRAAYLSQSLITGNAVDSALSPNSSGIYTNNCNMSSIIGNTVSNNGFAGIGIDQDDKCNIIGNTCLNNGNYGIQDYFATRCSITDNKISNTVGTGEQIGINIDRCKECTFSSNIVENSAGAGFSIVMDGEINKDNVLSGNISRNNAKEGFNIWGATDISLINNLAYLNKYDGISLSRSTSRCTVKGNISKNNGGNGIGLWQCHDSLIEGNICTDDQSNKTQQWGILVDSGSLNNNILNNFLKSNSAGSLNFYEGTGTYTFANRGYDI